MSHAQWPARGRPRGSGRPLRMEPIDLSQAEWAMVRIGIRVGRDNPEFAARWDTSLTELTAYLTSTERRQLAASELTYCVRWVGIGILYSVASHAVKALRAD